jgi:hypothetical protein
MVGLKVVYLVEMMVGTKDELTVDKKGKYLGKQLVAHLDMKMAEKLAVLSVDLLENLTADLSVDE